MLGHVQVVRVMYRWAAGLLEPLGVLSGQVEAKRGEVVSSCWSVRAPVRYQALFESGERPNENLR